MINHAYLRGDSIYNIFYIVYSARTLYSPHQVYPDLHHGQQSGCYHSIQHLLASLHSDQEALQWLLSQLTYQVTT